jgi:hypothetical protein
MSACSSTPASLRRTVARTRCVLSSTKRGACFTVRGSHLPRLCLPFRMRRLLRRVGGRVQNPDLWTRMRLQASALRSRDALQARPRRLVSGDQCSPQQLAVACVRGASSGEVVMLPPPQVAEDTLNSPAPSSASSADSLMGNRSPGVQPLPVTQGLSVQCSAMQCSAAQCSAEGLCTALCITERW